jgi:hypothetical protein
MTQEEFIRQYQQKANSIWANMSVDEYGSVYMNAQNQKIKYENLKYIQKDGKNFIYDSSTQRLYDQMFNYYHEGNYYNPFGQLVQEVDNPDIIEGSYREIIDEPIETSVKNNPKRKKYKAKKGPKLKQDAVNEKPIPKRKKYKAKKGPKLKPKGGNKNEFFALVEQSAQELAKKEIKATNKLSTKSLNGGGKLAIGAAIAGLIIGGLIATDEDEDKKQNRKSKYKLSRTTNSEEIDNSYAMQMAQDISSYRYGKHMTGFVNH